MNKVQTITGNLLKTDIQYIAHQCNAVTNKSAHLSKDVFAAFPWADIYTPRKNYSSVPMTEEMPGNIIVKGNGQEQRYVINIMGQYYPGNVKYSDSRKDGYRARQEYFASALNKILRIDNLEAIAFPHGIGCGAAGGDWDIYQKMISCFSQLTTAEVYIIQLKE